AVATPARPPPAAAATPAPGGAGGTPGSTPARSPTSWTVTAPCSPRTAALDAVDGPQLIASTEVASPRAAVSSSRLTGEIPLDVGSQRTQMVWTGIRAPSQIAFW